MDKAKLLVVDDDEGLCRQYRWAFPEYQIFTGQTRRAGRALFARERPPVAIVDLGLPPDPAGASEGLALVRELLGIAPDTKIMVATGNDDQRHALQAVAMGAFDFFHKPVDNDVLRVILERAYNLARLEDEARRARDLPRPSPIEHIITGDEQMLRLCRSVERLAATDVTVLLLGESGTGKEALAHALHDLGPRADRPFIPLNCGAIPEALLESELFGHERGAFTGAIKQTIGKIESANHGTLFLDEIGDLPAMLQVKLLRFLQNQVIERVGGRHPIQVDVRIVCATNQDLEARMQEGSFRDDLFYRLNEVTLRVAPLRERPGDPTLLASFFLHRFTAQFGRRIRGFTAEAIAAIAAHPWPGNVRELENRVKRAVVMSDGRLISASDLELAPPVISGHQLDIRLARLRAEREVVQKALSQSNGTISTAAKLLGISRPTLYTLLETHGLGTLSGSASDGRQAPAVSDVPRMQKQSDRAGRNGGWLQES
ncbi:MAG TPA: PEP-CTERM-box response regulator transcription factor [Stellaceae bacterium]|nr:PEP-CTERM-box response regulator transcription factor [Stellaceae bacterium]